MNDKDKEEFENFWDDNYDEKFPTPDKFRDSIIWQAACEYKQKEIDELKTQDQIIAKEIKTYRAIAEKLQAESAKLRECLKACPILGEVHADSNDRFKEWNLEYKYILKELGDK